MASFIIGLFGAEAHMLEPHALTDLIQEFRGLGHETSKRLLES